MNGKCYAAIDIGSNAVRLLIKKVKEDENLVNKRLSKAMLLRVPLRLGFDVFALGEVSDVKAVKLRRLMKAFRQLMKIYEVTDYRACATSAMRDAKNGKSIIKKILKDTGINIEVIDGQEEARMIYNNHIECLEDRMGNYIYVDVGGGSTEISIISDRSLLQSQSYNIGTVRILNKKLSRSELFRMYRDLKRLKETYRHISIIGSGGNINKLHHLAGVSAREPLTVERLLTLRNELNSYSIVERIDRFALKPDRADVIVPAADIYLQIATHIGAREIWVPTIGIVDGIIYSLCSDYLKEKEN